MQKWDDSSCRRSLPDYRENLNLLEFPFHIGLQKVRGFVGGLIRSGWLTVSKILLSEWVVKIEFSSNISFAVIA
jgi:hypothetical protein